MSSLDYKSRPAKAIVRQMIVECCRRLRGISKFSNYQYIGFGGLEFLDFDLFHRRLGIRDMISIESSGRTERYEFNRPFKSIDMQFGRASTMLPGLDWRGLKIVWLDYEDTLNGEVLRGCQTVARVLGQGSVLIVTMNAAARYGERLSELKQNLGDLVPIDITEEDLDEWGYAAAQRRVLTEV